LHRYTPFTAAADAAANVFNFRYSAISIGMGSPYVNGFPIIKNEVYKCVHLAALKKPAKSRKNEKLQFAAFQFIDNY